MRADPLEEGRRWLEQARVDLHWAEDLAGRGGYHLACFLAQQVAEKALKAFLYASGEEVVLGHSIARLCADAARYDPTFNEGASRWSILDAHYVPTRYPNSVPDSIPARIYTAQAAQDAVALAREAVRRVGLLLDARRS